jgi:hypothetical protein
VPLDTSGEEVLVAAAHGGFVGGFFAMPQGKNKEKERKKRVAHRTKAQRSHVTRKGGGWVGDSFAGCRILLHA